MSDVTSPHDRYFRETFSHRATLQDFIGRYLPADVVGRLDLRTLRVTDASYVDPELRLHVSDLVCRVRLSRENGDTYVCLLFEHKSRPDGLVALQVLRYMTGVWERARASEGSTPLPAVIPVVLYHGRERWNVPTEFSALVPCPAELRPYQPSFRYVLTDLSALGDDEIRGRVLLRAALLAMRHVHDGDLPARLSGILRLLRSVVDTRSGLRALEALLRYLGEASPVVGHEELTAGVREAFPMEGGKLMANAAEHWIEQGKQQGIEQGKRQGIEQGSVATARADVLEVLEARFERVPAWAVDRIDALEDVGALRSLLKEAATAESLERFRGALEGAGA